jgi:probable HAF family extracellular repeat protein
LWNGGLFQNLGTLAGTESYGNALNDSGVAVGGAMTGDGQLHAFQYGSGTMVDLGTLPGGTWSTAYAVNNLGVIAGTSDAADRSFRAVRWDTTGIHPLGTLGGANSYAFAINSAGQIAGSSTSASGYLHAFLYTISGGMADLGTLGGTSSYAYAINNSGDVVGYSFTPRDSSSHATLWRDGTLLDLNSLIAPSGSWVLNEAYGINDSGQIVGAGTYNGQARAFRLDPVSTFIASDLIATDLPTGIPEPATRYLVVICAGAMAYLALRRR